MTVDKQEVLRWGADALGDLVMELRAELTVAKSDLDRAHGKVEGLLEAVEVLHAQMAAKDAEIARLREAQRCDGCSSKGHYENEVECGYPSPCTGCVRRAPDNFMPLPAAPWCRDWEWRGVKEERE